ncbi:hypothetical protein [Tengunoibacter tsumagoiensis]|uniref:PLL-like beta propeller domain-containing protein n=1 Tax=Tengunoibacter tsumagoiensis TaxID=2014871 RepID=A0A402A3Z0_9CHLR|nr:hypothetical protein [Tengunoibacter tsumagoiensis]GCE13721.1 hypothetical protein KTT_35800 [Tengunoibacter tsumagoiensis]
MNFRSGPVLISHSDELMTLFVVTTSGSLWQICSTGVDTIWHEHGQPQDTEGSGELAARPAIAAHSDGRIELCAITHDGQQLWQRSQRGGREDWSPWLRLQLPSPTLRLNKIPALAISTSGQLELFVIAADGNLYHCSQDPLTTIWSEWHCFGHPANGSLANIPTLAFNSVGCLELFAVGEDGDLYHLQQTTPQGPWSTWRSHGHPPTGPLLTPLTDNLQPTLHMNAQGQLTLFIADGDLHQLSQQSPSGEWSEWQEHGHPQNALVFNNAQIVCNSSGALEVFVLGTNFRLYHVWQTRPQATWSDWTCHGQPAGTTLEGTLAVTASTNGTLTVFAVGENVRQQQSDLYLMTQSSLSGPWSSWISLSTPVHQTS